MKHGLKLLGMTAVLVATLILVLIVVQHFVNLFFGPCPSTGLC